MLPTEQILFLARWSGYLTLFCAALMLLGFVLQWGVRFRLVGATGFMGVLTAGLFTLSVSLYSRPEIPGAVSYSRVFDTGGDRVVIAVAPEITPEQVQATLQQAAADLYSPGRLAQGDSKMTIRVRTVLHTRPGISELVYLGQIRRSLANRTDNEMAIELFQDQFAQLPTPTA